MSKSMKFNIILGCIVLVVFGLDIYSKSVIVNIFNYEPHPISDSISVIGDFFKLTYVQNHGITFGMLSHLPIIQSIIVLSLTSITALLILLYFFKNINKLLQAHVIPLGKIALCLILGGAFGNIVDRLMRGFVVDFLDFGYKSHRWYIFNVADSFIVVGCITLSILMFFFEVKPNANKE